LISEVRFHRGRVTLEEGGYETDGEHYRSLVVEANQCVWVGKSLEANKRRTSGGGGVSDIEQLPQIKREKRALDNELLVEGRGEARIVRGHAQLGGGKSRQTGHISVNFLRGSTLGKGEREGDVYNSRSTKMARRCQSYWPLSN